MRFTAFLSKLIHEDHCHLEQWTSHATSFKTAQISAEKSADVAHRGSHTREIFENLRCVANVDKNRKVILYFSFEMKVTEYSIKQKIYKLYV